jgi:hypothetical protein
LLFATAVALTGCKKDEKKEGPTGDTAKTADAAQVAATAADAAAAPATDDGGAAGGDRMVNETGNCPSTIVGAETKVDEKASKDGKVVVAITSKEKDVVPTIRARAKHLVDVQGAPDTTVKHTGEGTGGGAGGLCPVFAGEGQKVSMKEIDGGVQITLETAKDKGDALLTEVKARVDKAKTWTGENIKQEGEFGAKGGDGGLTGGHGGNRTGKGDASGPRAGGGGGKGTGGGGGKGTGGGDGKGDVKADDAPLPEK